eukprot:scaffold4772_cov145-Skeletonema_menzelii.AAC.7
MVETSPDSFAMNDQDKFRGEVIVLDGGMGHELKSRGISDGSFVAGVLANENLLQASTVEAIHYDYLAAGCDVITTNSFVAVPRRMRECGLATDEPSAFHRAAVLIRSAVDRARAATQIIAHDGKMPQKQIAGCIPPLTECYFGDQVPTIEDMIPEYVMIVSTLIDCKVDIFLCETLSTCREAIAILRALSQSNSRNIPIWVSYTIKDDISNELRSGDSLMDACSQIIKLASSLKLPLEAIGVNCSSPSAISKALLCISPLVSGSGLKLCAYGNCFQTTTSEWMASLNGDNDKQKESKRVTSAEEYDHNGYLLPEAYARYAREWAALGAQIIGGCCGSRPQHMKQVASILRS